MKKNLYFRAMVRRENHVKNFIYEVFFKVCSLPRLLLETFIRSRFGEQYFKRSAVATVAFILLLWPRVVATIPKLFMAPRYLRPSSDNSEFWLHYGTWYAFIALFLFFAYRRWQEIKRQPSVFDFGKHSLYDGDINPIFYDLHPLGKRPTMRAVMTIYEPLFFLFIGTLLWFMGQRIGPLLCVCSVIYSISYRAAYKRGDDFTCAIINEMITNEEMEEAFVSGVFDNNERGVRFYMERPKDVTLRRKLAEAIVEDGDGDRTFAE